MKSFLSIKKVVFVQTKIFIQIFVIVSLVLVSLQPQNWVEASTYVKQENFRATWLQSKISRLADTINVISSINSNSPQLTMLPECEESEPYRWVFDNTGTEASGTNTSGGLAISSSTGQWRKACWKYFIPPTDVENNATFCSTVTQPGNTFARMYIIARTRTNPNDIREFMTSSLQEGTHNICAEFGTDQNLQVIGLGLQAESYGGITKFDNLALNGFPEIPINSSILNDRSTFSNNQPKNGSGDPRECAVNACNGAQATAGDPINTQNGNFDYGLVDLSLQTVAGPLTFQRSYASLATNTTIFPTQMGPGWSHNQDIRLIIDNANGVAWFKGHTINQYQFTRAADGLSYLPYPGVLASLTDNPDGTFLLKAADQSTYLFEASTTTNEYRLREWRNELGFGFNYSYNTSNPFLYRVTEPLSGRFLQFFYVNNRLTKVEDNTLRAIIFQYDAAGDLFRYTDTLGVTWTYTYSNHRLTTIQDGRTSPVTVLSTFYDSQGRAYEQRNGNGAVLVSIVYNDTNHTATITDAMGRSRTDFYDSYRKTIQSQSNSSGLTQSKDFDWNFRPTKLNSLKPDQTARTTTLAWSSDGANLTYIKDAENYETFLDYDSLNHLTEVKDPEGNFTTFTYNGNSLVSIERKDSFGTVTSVTSYTYTTLADAPEPVGLVKTITDPLGNLTTFYYDTAGQLETIEKVHQNDNGESENIVTSFDYDDLGRIENVTDALGRVTRYQYNAASQLTFVTSNFLEDSPVDGGSEYNLITEYQYDPFSGRLESIYDPQRRLTSYEYDLAGQLRYVTNPAGETTEYRYNAAGQVENVIAPHPAGALEADYTTQYVYDLNTGQLTSIIDPTNVTTEMTYDSDGTLISVTQPLGQVIQYEYDDLLRVTRIFDNLGHSTAYTYDGYGNVETVTDAMSRLTHYEYNAFNLISAVVENEVTNPLPDADANATNVRTEYVYDAAGNLTHVYDANHINTSLASMTYTYDDLNRLKTATDALGNTTTYYYDLVGNQTSVLDAEGSITAYSYDGENRLKNIDYGNDGLLEVTFTYNPSGDLVEMQDTLGVTQWTPDELGRPLSITDPYNQVVQYQYDDAGNLEKLIYPDLRAIDYRYDGAGRLQEVLEGAAQLAAYQYDFSARKMTASYANGIQSVSTFDAVGQLVNLYHQSTSGLRASYDYQYDLVGNRTYANEEVLKPTFTYIPVALNAASTAQSLSTATFEGTELFNDLSGGYPAPDGSLLENNPDNPSPEFNGDANLEPVTNTSPDLWGALVQFVRDLFAGPHVVHAATIPDYQSGYPVPTSTPPESGGGEPAESVIQGVEIIYEYDDLDRLKSANYSTGEVYSYNYDKVGNRLEQTLPDGSTTTYQYDGANRLSCINGDPFTCANGTVYTWDNNGNLLSDGASTYSYDSANRLSTVNGPAGSFQFDYNGLGHRLQQTANGVQTRYALDLSGLPQVLSDGTNTYLYGRERFAFDGPAGRSYLLPDALGSVRQVMTSENLITLAQSFDPFGNLRERQGNSATAYGYAGEWADASGLINLRARYYDPAQGRFLTRDPFPGVLPQPATLQPYQYVVNNPVLLTDPSGEIAPLLIIAGIGFAAGAISNAYQQTNGFTDFCRYDILETLAWGVGGAAAASTFAIMSITGVGFLGMGIQGAAIGLSNLGISASSSIFLAGSAAVGLSNATMTWLFTSTSSIANINQTLSTAASRAQQTVGPGRGAVYGTRVHTAFSQEVSTLRQSNLKSEVSYLSGQIVQYGTSGSVRIDVVYGPIDNPIAVFDLKTGSAALTTSRIEQIQSNLPRPNIPIFEVRP